jgi:histidinol-phosphate/aromatic aminotransferase/cobyric acid decarboxylase-like protein
MAVEPPGPREHGGPALGELDRLGVSRNDVLDFSVNLNPYGPHPMMIEAIGQARIDVYPDSTSGLARERLGASLAVAPERIVIGNGAADLLWTLASVLIGPGKTALIVEPTFSEFRAGVGAGHGRAVEWRADPEDDFRIDVPAVCAAVRAAGATAIYLCAPNNPTGASVSRHEIARLAGAIPEATLVLDQAFLSLSEAHADAGADFPDNVVRVRSLTKEHAIPGVRVGFLVASATLAATVERARAAWTTSAAAQAAASASVILEPFVADSRERMLADRRRLVEGLLALGLKPSRTVAGFCVVRVTDAAALRRRLLVRHRILVRDCSSFGLPDHIRIGARPRADTEHLVAALAEEVR